MKEFYETVETAKIANYVLLDLGFNVRLVYITLIGLTPISLPKF